MNYNPNDTKLKPCSHCGTEFTAKRTKYQGYQDYCPTCVGKRVWAHNIYSKKGY